MKRLIQSVVGVACTLAAVAASAEIVTKTISYQHGTEQLTGYAYYDDAIEGKRPGILVVHEWWGLNQYAKDRAKQLAELGYVAFAVDMYGANKVTEHPSQAKQWMSTTTANIDQWRSRAQLGLEKLRSLAVTDTERLAAIGYCFGGATVMQLAYTGADLDVVVSFHGSLPLPQGDEAKHIKAKVLIEHGNDDAFVPASHVQAFTAAMQAAEVDLSFNGYDGARHAFTNADAAKFGIDNLKYDAAADTASWQSMLATFKAVFK